MDRWNKIIQKKINKVKDDPTFEIIKDKSDNSDSRYLVMFKLNGGHYKDQLHILSLDFKCGLAEAGPDKWFPVNPPKTYFVTKILHTNVSPSSGWICLDVLSHAWSPMNNIDTLVQCIVLLLDDPSPTGNHLNGDAAKLQQSSQKNYNSLTKSKKLSKDELDLIYADCFREFDEKCLNYYNEHNKSIIEKYMPLFSKFK